MQPKNEWAGHHCSLGDDAPPRPAGNFRGWDPRADHVWPYATVVDVHISLRPPFCVRRRNAILFVSFATISHHQYHTGVEFIWLPR